MSSNSPKHILVLGAGELGSSILHSLAAHPVIKRAQADVTVLLRPETLNSPHASQDARLASLKSLGIALLACDIATANVPTLASIFTPFDTIISCTGFVAGPGTQIKIAQAALEAGAETFVPWQFGVDYDVIGKGSAMELFDEQLAVRELLRGQHRTSWVIVSTGVFTSFLFEPAFGVVVMDGAGEDVKPVVRALGSWENEVTVTAVEDIGALTARVVLEEPELKNQVVFVAGDTISYARLAEVVERICGKKVKRELWDVDRLRKELEKDPQHPIRKYRVVFAEGRGVAWGLTSTFNGQKGYQTTDVEQWARQHLRRDVELV